MLFLAQSFIFSTKHSSNRNSEQATTSECNKRLAGMFIYLILHSACCNRSQKFVRAYHTSDGNVQKSFVSRFVRACVRAYNVCVCVFFIIRLTLYFFIITHNTYLTVCVKVLYVLVAILGICCTYIQMYIHFEHRKPFVIVWLRLLFSQFILRFFPLCKNLNFDEIATTQTTLRKRIHFHCIPFRKSNVMSFCVYIVHFIKFSLGCVYQ